jgi:hypothetical protein
MRFGKAIVAALCLTAVPHIAEAQVAAANAEAAAGAQAGSASQAMTGDNTVNFGDTNVGAGHRPVPNISVFAPAPTAPCRGTGGIGASWGGGGVGASFGARDDECNAREDARSWVSFAGAAHALGDASSARLDLETARQVLLMSNDQMQAARDRARNTLIEGPQQ